PWPERRCRRARRGGLPAALSRRETYADMRGAGVALGLMLLTGCGGNAGAERVILPPGTTFSAVTDSLIAHRVVTSRKIFKLLARLRGVDRSVQAGIYEFKPGV